MRPGEFDGSRIGIDIQRLQLVSKIARGAACVFLEVARGNRCRRLIACVSHTEQTRLSAPATDCEIHRSVFTDDDIGQVQRRLALVGVKRFGCYEILNRSRVAGGPLRVRCTAIRRP